MLRREAARHGEGYLISAPESLQNFQETLVKKFQTRLREQIADLID